jgi:FKBP-type peptidyl-prolyl cis-trans isomerase FkpA
MKSMSVTAVPLRPLGKGTILKIWIGILLVVLMGVGLAWIGTSRLQFARTDNGIRYRAWAAGEGEPMTSADVAQAEVQQLDPQGKVMMTSQPGRPEQLLSDAVPAWMNPILLQMRQNGVYQLYVPARVLLEGRPVPPGSPIHADDEIQFRIHVGQIDRGGAQDFLMRQQMQQQMMQQQMEQVQGPGGQGPAGPGGTAPGGAGPAPAPRSPRGGAGIH